MAIIPSPIEKLNDPLFNQKGLEVYIKRDDLIHSYIMGNKWRKLKYNLKYAKEEGYEGILTVGGAFSNHISATAACCFENGLKSIGIIRGNELHEQSNATLRFAARRKMQLKFVSRENFRLLKNSFSGLQNEYPTYYCLPEGGTNDLAIKGCEELIKEIDIPFDYVTTPIGTGGTMAGMLKGLKGEKKLLGFSALKGEFIKDEFSSLIKRHGIAYPNYEIFTNFHFGGYGKASEGLVDFINKTYENSQLLFDPVYTGKMYFGLKELVRDGYFNRGIRIIVVHTGGLQGIEGFNENRKTKIFSP